MTVLVRGNNSYFMGARAFLMDDDRETASDWAGKYMQSNPAIKWVLGKYVEADNPNNNKQAWALEDLRMNRPSINHAPMNMVHQRNHIVGAFVANELLYPTDDAADEGTSNPYIETLGAFWKYYFPEEFAEVEAAHNEGKLFFSMECVAKTITFDDPGSGEKETFPYRGPRDASYGDKWNMNANATRWLDSPHFLGGALIIPPLKPGWSGAEIKDLAQYMEANAEMAQAVYEGVESQSPHLSPEQIEQVTIELLKGDAGTDLAELVGATLNKSASVDEDRSDTSSDSDSLVGGEPVSDEAKYTDSDVAAKVAEAMAPLQAKLDELTAAKDAEGVEAKISEIKAQYDGEVAELQTQLDAVTIERDTYKSEFETFKAELQEAADAASAEAAAEARKEERVAAVKEVANFSDDDIEARSTRWAALNDEDFASLIEDYKSVAEAAKAAAAGSEDKSDKGGSEDLSTAMSTEREEASEKSGMALIGGFMRSTVMGDRPETL
jgi:hypothetical protein